MPAAGPVDSAEVVASVSNALAAAEVSLVQSHFYLKHALRCVRQARLTVDSEMAADPVPYGRVGPWSVSGQ